MRWIVARAVLGAILRPLFRIHRVGTAPRSGPFVLVANHQGWLDPFAIFLAFRARPRIWGFADKHAIVPWAWKRWLLAFFEGVVLVDRKVAADRSAIADALRVLGKGDALLLFPEGRVSYRENDLGEFERGTAYLAIKAQTPVVPVWLSGTAELYLGRDITVRIGRPRTPPPLPATKEATESFARALHDEVAALAIRYVEPVGVRKRWRWLTRIL